MEASVVLLTCVIGNGILAESQLKFPAYFKFGAATSAYQIEGGWNVDDKSPSIWDVYTHSIPNATESSNGDIACDSYNLWKEDVRIISNLGLDYYRFSISWTRILPKGTPEYISKSGYTYYSNLIDALLEKHIEPVVTIYHFDLPQRFSNMAPVAVDYDIGYFQCIKNSMIAHAKAWRVYDEEFRKKFKGRVGMTNIFLNLIPATKEDESITELVVEFLSGLYIHPIHSKTGGWPSAIEDVIAKNSEKRGYRRSRLPAFTDEEKELVRGTGDFIGLNFYMSKIVRKVKDSKYNFKNNSVLADIPELNVILESEPSWQKRGAHHLDPHPEGLRSVLSWLKNSFGDMEIIIFENGYGTSAANLHDQDRVDFIKKHLEQVLLAIYEDKVNVTRFTAWALMDDFEWTAFYTIKYGLYEVDFTSPNRTRTPRDSARYYKQVISTRSIDPPNYYYNISGESYFLFFFFYLQHVCTRPI